MQKSVVNALNADVSYILHRHCSFVTLTQD